MNTDDRGNGLIVIVEFPDELSYQAGDLIDVGALIHSSAGFVVAHEDRAGAPTTRPRLQVVPRHHEVKALD